jgi:hypothetical protein
MQVSFFAPALAPSAPAATTAVDLPSTSTGDKAEAFASVLDARSEGRPRPDSRGKETPVSGEAAPTETDEYDCARGAPAEPEAEVPVAEADDDATDLLPMADAAVAVVPPVLPLPAPLPAPPASETVAPGVPEAGAAETPGNRLPMTFAAAIPRPDASAREPSGPPAAAGKAQQPMADAVAKQQSTDSTNPAPASAAATPSAVVPTGLAVAPNGPEVPARGDQNDLPTGEAAGAIRGSKSAPWRVLDRARTASAEIIVRDAGETAPTQATTNAPNAPSGTSASGAAAGLLGAAPTLAQTLVETVVANAPRPTPPGAATGLENKVPSAATVPVLTGEEGVPPLSQDNPDAETAGAAAVVHAGVEGEPHTDSPVRGLREILASAGGKSGRADRAVPKGAGAQNFQTVEKQRVGGGAPEVGMHTAEKAQPMSTNATVLPPADAALETFELPASPAQATGAGSTTAAKPLADVGATRSFAAAAVREVMNAVERTQDTGHAHVELRLQTHDDESLRVHLQWRDGVVHAKFVTQTAEMQRALSSEWDAVAPRLAEKGLKFSEPSFEHNGQQSESQPGQSGFAFNQQQRRSGSHSADANESPDFALPFARATGAATATRRPASRTTVNNRIVLPETRGLRVWA